MNISSFETEEDTGAPWNIELSSWIMEKCEKIFGFKENFLA